MKRTSFVISAVALTLGLGPVAFADHDQDCKATHGTVTAKSGNSVTVGGKTYTVDSSAASTLASVNTGDKVCLETSSGDAKQVSKIMVMNEDHATAKNRLERARTYASEKLSDLERETHEKMCKGNHGTITDKTADSITVDGKKYALRISTPVNKQGEPLLPKTTKVGDRVCFTTMKASDGSQQLDKLIALDRESDTKVRVREKTTDDTDVEIKTSDDKVKIQTDDTKVKVDADDKKIEVK